MENTSTCAEVVGDDTAQDPASVPVSDDAQVAPALAGGQVGDVGEPGDIAASLVEAAFDLVGCQNLWRMVGEYGSIASRDVEL